MTDDTEFRKAQASQPYDPQDPYCLQRQDECQAKVRRLNATYDEAERGDLIKDLLDVGGNGTVRIRDGFRCEIGKNIHVTGFLFVNFDCTILDMAPVIFGNGVALGPSVHIYTITHPTNPYERIASFLENNIYNIAKSVTIGDNVMIGGHTTILPGVKIGNNVWVGAGSVVTQDVEDGCVVAGSPAKVIKYFPEGEGRDGTGVKFGNGSRRGSAIHG